MDHSQTSGWRLDLLKLLPPLKWLVTRRWFQFAVILPNLLLFLVFLLAGVFGSPLGNRNIIVVFVWIFWWFLLISVMVPFASRVWCTVCPFPFFGEWMQRRALVGVRAVDLKAEKKKAESGPGVLVGRNRYFGLNLRWPKSLTNIWLQNIGFLALCTFSAFFLTRPIVSVFVLGGMFLMATVLFRFKSADVVHTFYSPELGIGPVEVYPGHVAEVEITPTEPGAYDYYCTTVCGAPHFRMRGQIIVAPAEPSFDDPGEYWLAEEPEDASLVERGQWLFRRHACFSCHGRDGHGGVRNPNYAKETVPALDVLAEQAYLYHPEDIETIVALLEQRTPLEELWDQPPVPLFHALLGKYQAVRDIIRKGSPAGKLDPEGREPPLSMPTWGQQLTDDDIDALIAYLLTLEPLAYSPQFGG